MGNETQDHRTLGKCSNNLIKNWKWFSSNPRCTMVFGVDAVVCIQSANGWAQYGIHTRSSKHIHHLIDITSVIYFQININTQLFDDDDDVPVSVSASICIHPFAAVLPLTSHCLAPLVALISISFSFLDCSVACCRAYATFSFRFCFYRSYRRC